MPVFSSVNACMKSSSSRVKPVLPERFCKMIRSLPTSVLAVSVKVLLGSRSAVTRFACFISSMRTNGLFPFITPWDVINAMIPPSRTVSRPFRKK